MVVYMQKTKIEWATMTWNPVTGCLNGCLYCYAKTIANRFKTGLGCGKPFVYESAGAGPYPANFDPTFHEYRLGEPQAVRKSQRIFVVSMGDLFGPWVPDEWILKVFDACKKASQHKYMFLTKNPIRYRQLAMEGLLPKLDNFWYGQSCTQGIVSAFYGDYHQFVSAEPLQGIVEAFGFELVIIGAETGNRKDKYPLTRYEVDRTVGINNTVFMKGSCLRVDGINYLKKKLPQGLLIDGDCGASAEGVNHV